MVPGLGVKDGGRGGGRGYAVIYEIVSLDVLVTLPASDESLVAYSKRQTQLKHH